MLYLGALTIISILSVAVPWSIQLNEFGNVKTRMGRQLIISSLRNGHHHTRAHTTYVGVTARFAKPFRLVNNKIVTFHAVIVVFAPFFVGIQ
jgi:hypothetical protein